MGGQGMLSAAFAGARRRDWSCGTTLTRLALLAALSRKR
jgi:hypothetical protein